MATIPKAPATLSPSGKKRWARLLRTCNISEAELSTLQLMLEAWDECNEIRAQIKKFGPIIRVKSRRLSFKSTSKRP